MPRFAFKQMSGLMLVLSLLMLMAGPLAMADSDMMEESVYVSVRHYDGINPDNMEEITRHTREGFLPITRASEGFVGYYWMGLGEVAVAINLFETAEQASASNEAASDYVAEHLAEVASNPPMIVEGMVDIGFVEMLDGMGGGEVDSLYASVRLYDGFETDDLDAFVAIVEDGFLPLMRETDGFFGYYVADNGAGMLAAISIFDSEESALASNEKARDFVAENLAEYLPNDPLIAAGSLSVAALAEVDAGRNLVGGMMDEMMEESVFVSVRRYDGVDPDDMGEIARQVEEGFLPIISAGEGFVGYYWMGLGDVVVAINFFESAEQASASNEAARDFVAENLAAMIPNAPMIVEGLVDIGFVEMLDGMGEGDVDSLYASVRLYDPFETDDLDEFVAIVEGGFLPLMRETDGFFGYYVADNGAGMLAAISIFDSEESALASNEKARDFVAENLAEFLPNDPLIAAGPLGIAVLAEVDGGRNLVGMMGGE